MMKVSKKLLTLALAAMLLLSLAAPAMAADSDFEIVDGVLEKYNGTGGDVVIPNSVTKIGNGVFMGNSEVTSVTIPSGVTEIGGQAFLHCNNMTSITIPSSVTAIGGGALTSCPSLTEVYFGGTEEEWRPFVDRTSDKFVWVVFDKDANFTVHYNSTGPEASETPTAPSFSDVSAKAYYAEPVAWAVNKGVTNGTGNNKFSPDKTCNTAEILTFLWRACGKPQAETAGVLANNISSVIWFADAVAWAESKGMVSNDTFDRDAPCTRASTVMYMWQAAGSPAVDTKTSFTDVPADADYAMAVAWAVENGVTTGTSATAFSPDQTCTRGQIATFLYRAFAE